MSASSFNIASRFDAVAAAAPDKPAVLVSAGGNAAGEPAWRSITFAESAARCNRYARGLQAAGVARGMKVLLMVRPGFDLAPLVFALFKLGAVPVLIDPGMGWKNLMHAIRQVAPEAFIGVPQAHLLRLLSPGSFKSVRLHVMLGGFGFGRTLSLDRISKLGDAAGAGVFPAVATSPEDMAAILFTSGSTGPAKGVIYTHRIFDAQVRLLQEVYGITPADIDLPCFPLFGLFSTAMGVTSVIPDMDFTRPAHVDPMHIIEPVNACRVTYSFGSPALWETVAAFCTAREIELPSLRRIFMAGAPVPAQLHQVLKGKVLTHPDAETCTPYGATESLPVATIGGAEVLHETARLSAIGAGTCVGRPVPGVDVRILPISDVAVEAYPAGRELPPGEIGEIAVCGEVVTPGYYGLEEATRLAKMRDAAGRLWHRIGDCGYLDGKGRLWFCGRKAHRVRTPQGTMFSIPCEAIFRRHADVRRAALVGVGDFSRDAQEPVMVIEPRAGRFPKTPAARAEFTRQLLKLGAGSPLTAGIARILFHPAFPVDIRHNAKIRREDLAEWAAEEGKKGER